MKSSVKIVLAEDNVRIIQSDQDGKRTSRNIAIHELIAAMSDDIILRTGIMSPGIREYYVYGEKEVITVECPPKIREVAFRYEDKPVNIPYPPLLFLFGLKEGKMNNSSVFAIKEPFTNPNMPLYSFPLGDADANNGQICWGHSSRDSNYAAMNKVADYGVSNVQGLIVRFFSGKFNDNFTINNSSFTSPSDSKSKVTCATQLMQYLKDKRTFPLDILKKSNTTYEQMIKLIGDNRSVNYN